MSIEQVCIIGAGPAGLASAIQLKRYGIAALIFERGQIGGLLHNANLVENYPGFPNGLPGPDLAALFEKQMKKIGVKPIFQEVTHLDFNEDRFTLHSSQQTYQAHVAVVATGTKPKRFSNLPITPNLEDRICYEVTQLRNVTGKHVVIVGAGDAAFDYALNLGKNNRITILNRGNQLKCLPLLWQRASQNPDIHYQTNVKIKSVRGATNGRIMIDCLSDRVLKKIEADYLLGAIGREPNLDLLSPKLLNMTQKDKVRIRLYTIGDVHNGIFRQTAIAVGDGIRAAMHIHQTLGDTS
ncbi:MAG: NAD(P)/FAD-dependent oxidoreductase [Chloroflexota bacterium]